ncbi:MAG TPA: tetratricopeptide repeat protein [Candidatus Bathyarchaeia archaeon]|nr:tetratricopeptide repeat protein [Candidatus Bathyarchaeia archaeon]
MAKRKLRIKKTKKKNPKKDSRLFFTSWPGTQKWLHKFFLLFTGLFITVLIFYIACLPKNHFQRVRDKIIIQPNDVQARLELAEIYLKNNQFKEAERELTKIQSLKTSKWPNELLQALALLWEEKRQKDPGEIKKQIKNWEKTIGQYPDYRDGYLQLSFFYLKLGQYEKARENLNKAKALSPNYPVIKELEKSLLN